MYVPGESQLAAAAEETNAAARTAAVVVRRRIVKGGKGWMVGWFGREFFFEGCEVRCRGFVWWM